MRDQDLRRTPAADGTRARQLGSAVLALAVLGALALAASGFGARLGFWDWRVGFRVLGAAMYGSVAVALVALVMLLVRRVRAAARTHLVLALVVACATAALPLSWLQSARKVPPINDITTDVTNPPAFVALLAARASAPVSADYPGEHTGALQRSGYPDIEPVVLGEATAVAFDRALAVAKDMGWDIAAADRAAGRIEATATTPWFGFKDDVVIRIAPVPQGSRVDIRSVSRVGRSDLGANARRIREFVAKLTR